MFNIQQYISSFIAKYIEKYTISSNDNVRKDIKLSLWNGNLALDGLYLNVEAIEKEYPLPLSLSSGYIHELTIHVPWMKISSEPVAITITTIEIILKKWSSDIDVCQEEVHFPKDRTESTSDQLSYAKSILMKMFYNLNVTCNNVILKYAENPIVLTLTMKQLVVFPFKKHTDVHKVVMQKVINLSEITICLDKCNDDGKIEYYNEPISFGVSLLIHYSTNKATKAQKGINDKFEIFCKQIEFVFNEQQLLLLSCLFEYFVLKDKEKRTHPLNDQFQKQTMSQNLQEVLQKVEDGGNSAVDMQTWSTWFFDTFSMNWFDENDDQVVEVQNYKGRILQFAFYFDVINIKLKLFEIKEKHSFLKNLKNVNTEMMQFKLMNCYAETVKYSKDWFNIVMGIGEIQIKSLGNCTCGFNEPESENYIIAGEKNHGYIEDNEYLTFEKSIESSSDRLKYHFESVTEENLLRRTRAFALDYLWYQSNVDDLEEKQYRVFLNNFQINITSGLLHRSMSLMTVYKNLRKLLDTPESSYRNNRININSRKIFHIYILHPIVMLDSMNHPYFKPTENYYSSKILIENLDGAKTQLPKIAIEIDKIELTYSKPIFPKWITSEQYALLSNNLDIVVCNIFCRLELNGDNILFLSISQSDYCQTTIPEDKLTANPKLLTSEIKIIFGSSTFIGSKRTLLILEEIFRRNFNRNFNDFDLFNNSSLLQPHEDKVLIESTFENTIFTKLTYHNHSTVIVCELSSANVIIFEASDASIFNDPKHIVIVSNDSLEPMFSIVIEYDDRFEVIELKKCNCNMSDIHFNLDSLFNEWLQYEPQVHEHASDAIAPKKISFSRKNSGSKNYSFLRESVHKSSEKDYISLSPSILSTDKVSIKSDRKFQWSLLKVLFNSKDLILSALIDRCSIIHNTICSLNNENEIFILNLDQVRIETVKNKMNKSSRNPNEIVFGVQLTDLSCHTLHTNQKFYVLQPISIFSQFFVDTSLRKINFHIDISQLTLNLSQFQLITLLKTSQFIQEMINGFHDDFKRKISQVLKIDNSPIQKDKLSMFEESLKDSLIDSTSESSFRQKLQKIRNDNDFCDDTSEIVLKIWGQITCAIILVQIYAIEQDSPILASQKFDSNIKIVLSAEDSGVSCTMRDSYMRFDVKMVTFRAAHFCRNNGNDEWELGAYSGVLVQRWIDHLLELEKAPLITSTIVIAFRNDVYKKWLQEPSAAKLGTNTLLCEVNLKLMPIEIIVPIKLVNLLQPIVHLVQNIYQTLHHKVVSNSRTWLNNKLPLLNFECQRLRIIIPIEKCPNSNNTLLLYFENILIEQRVNNLLHRSFIIKPDLFNKAARDGILSIPGSVLEDRQYVVKIEAVYSFSSGWNDMLTLMRTEKTLSDFRLMNENPAAQWYRRLTDIDGLKFFPIAHRVSDINFVIAPAMYFNEQIICGHAFELNFPSKLDFVLHLSQLRLLKDFVNQFSSFQSKTNSLFEDNIPFRNRIKTLNDFIPSEFLTVTKEVNFTFYDQDSDSLIFLIRFLYPSILIQSFNNIMEKNQMTCSDFQIRFSRPNNKINDNYLWQNIDIDLFNIDLTETKNGKTCPKTEISPNFGFLKWKKRFSSTDLSILKPISFKIDQEVCNILSRLSCMFQELRQKEIKPSSKFDEIHIKSNQLLLKLECQDSGVRLNISWEQLEFLAKKQWPYNLKITDLTVCNSTSNKERQIFLKPTYLNLQLKILQESWQNESDYQILINIQSPIMSFTVNKFHLNNLKAVKNEFYDVFLKMYSKKTNFPAHAVDNDKVATAISVSKNDLCSQNFQVVLNSRQLPLAYQMVFSWENNDLFLTWCYPQPRLLTDIEVLPFQCEDNICTKIVCELYYWCECSLSFRYYETFYWSNTHNFTRDLLQSQEKIASIWQIRFKNIDRNIDKNMIISSLKVNSTFSQHTFNKLRIFWTIQNFEIAFNHNFFNNNCTEYFGDYKISNLKRINIDLMSCKIRDFNTLITVNSKKIVTFDINNEILINYLNFLNTNYESILEPMILKSLIVYKIDQNSLNLKFNTEFVKLHYNSSVYHSIKSVLSVWDDNLDKSQLIFYMICNSTSEVLEFGQADTSEVIEIGPKFCWCYSWKDYQKSLKVRLKLQSNHEWSNEFSLEPVQEFGLHFENNTIIFIKIFEIEKNHLKIIITGQISIFNTFHEMLVISLIKDKSDFREFIGKRDSTSYFNDYKSIVIKIRHKDENIGSGVITFEKINQARFVKIPFKDKYKSVICQIFVEKIADYDKVLIMIMPMFVVRSYLPLISKMLILTPDCNESQNVDDISNFGDAVPLFCYGSVEHRQQFYFDPIFPSISGEMFLEVKYDSKDFKKLYKKHSYVSVDEVIEEYETSMKNKWFSDKYLKNLRQIKWKYSENFKPFCKFKLSTLSQYHNVSLIEYVPWWAVFNTCPMSISIIDEDDVEVANIAFEEIAFPSKFEKNFRMRINDNHEVDYSSLMKFDKKAKEKSFYVSRSKIELLPLDGVIFIPIIGNNFVYTILLNTFINVETQVLHFSSNYILHNQTKTNLKVVGVVLESNAIISMDSLPLDAIRTNAITLTSSLANNLGVPLMKWLKLTELNLQNCCYYLLITTENGQWTGCPVLIDRNERKKCTISIQINKKEHIPICVTLELLNYQYYISINYDCPQFVIENRTTSGLICEQFQQSNCKHFQWNCLIGSHSYNFYTVPTLYKHFPFSCDYKNAYKLILRTQKEPTESSESFSCAEFTELYLNLRPLGEIKVTISNSEISLIKITVEQVNYRTINAKTIYQKLMSNDDDEGDGEVGDEVTNEENKQFDFGRKKLEASSTNQTENQDNIDSNNPKIIHFGEQKESKIKFNFEILFEKLKLVLSLERNCRKKALSTITCENFLATFNELSDTNIYVQNFQVDNNLYYNDSFDFPVVLLGIMEKPDENEFFHSKEDFIKKNAFFRWNLLIFKRRISSTDYFLSEIESNIRMKLASIFIEEKFYSNISELSYIFNVSKLLNRKQTTTSANHTNLIPREILNESHILAQPLIIRKFVIEKLDFFLSLHTSIQIYIAIDRTSLKFKEFACQSILISPYHFGTNFSKHYIYNAIYSVPSIVGSFELAGNITGLVRNVTSGLKDFVQMPYNGLLNGPVDFLIGLSDGSKSLLAHLSAGTITSITNLAESVARNLDRMSLDAEHIESSEEQRRERPENIVQGLSQGFTDFGIHLLGAIVGVAHHPLMTVFNNGLDVTGILKGVGLGVVGIVTKPLSGAAKLVSLTGQGLLTSTGWNNLSVLKCSEYESSLESGLSAELDLKNKLINYLEDHLRIQDVVLSSIFARNAKDEKNLLLISETHLIIFNLVTNDIQYFNASLIETVQTDDHKLRIFCNEATDQVDYRQLRVSKYVQSTNLSAENSENCLIFDCVLNERDLFFRFLHMFSQHNAYSHFRVIFQNSDKELSCQDELTSLKKFE